MAKKQTAHHTKIRTAKVVLAAKGVGTLGSVEEARSAVEWVSI